MPNIKERTLETVGIILFFIVLIALPSLAKFSVAEDVESQAAVSNFVWVMFPSWIYLGGAIIMLALGTKYMAGGSLSKPFTLMGFALLIDALVQIVSSLSFIGLIPQINVFEQIVFGVGLLFRLSVVFGMVWIGNIFGVLRSPSKPAAPSTPPTSS